MAGNILIIRGGAIGDFILTLPAIRLVRDAFPAASVEILGYRHIIAIAEKRYYADRTRSIEYGPLAGFFNPKSDLDRELCEYFAGFDQVISYLFDPDGYFGGNLQRAGVRNLIVGDPRIRDGAHATIQLAAPLGSLALFLEESAAEFYPSHDDVNSADALLQSAGPRPWIAIHPGSGGERKNWPLARWIDLVNALLRAAPMAQVLVIGGEADVARIAALRGALDPARVRFLEDLPLPTLGAALMRCDAFLGHDSGISHLAAAAGVPAVLLFGPTDPDVWAPASTNVRIIESPTGEMADIPLDSVLATTESILADA